MRHRFNCLLEEYVDTNSGKVLYQFRDEQTNKVINITETVFIDRDTNYALSFIIDRAETKHIKKFQISGYCKIIYENMILLDRRKWITVHLETDRTVFL